MPFAALLSLSEIVVISAETRVPVLLLETTSSSIAVSDLPAWTNWKPLKSGPPPLAVMLNVPSLTVTLEKTK